MMRTEHHRRTDNANEWAPASSLHSRNRRTKGVLDIPVGVSTYRWYALDIDHPSLLNLRRWYNSLTEWPAFRREVMLPLS